MCRRLALFKVWSDGGSGEMTQLEATSAVESTAVDLSLKAEDISTVSRMVLQGATRNEAFFLISRA